MRIEVDRARCEGVGMCESMAHRYFEVDDDEVLHVLQERPEEAHLGEVDAAVASCPVQALRLVD